MRRAISIAVMLTAAFAVAGCGGSKKPKSTIPTPTTPGPTTTSSQPQSRPEVVLFKGPSVVSCGKKGEIKTVSFRYKTRHASAVEPEIDGQAPGAQAGYDPAGGTMRFAYRCPGPHKLTIAAFGQGGKQATKSVTVEPSSSG